MAESKRQQVTLVDVIDELTQEQVRKIIAILGLTKPRERQVPAQKQPAA